MTSILVNPDTGLLLHGRHVEALEWERMIWGDPEHGNLGSGPEAILSILDEGVSRLDIVTIGTGSSSKPDGTVEAEAMQGLILEKYDGLDEFQVIHSHPLWPENKGIIRSLIEDAALDTTSQNTAEEIARAARLFTVRGLHRVIEVTGASHGPRCQVLQGSAREKGVIPRNQRWRLITDDEPFAWTSAGDTLVIEEPHRGDDPAIHFPPELTPSKVFRKYFQLPQSTRLAFLGRVAHEAQVATQDKE
jgi:hypothetical protein